MTTHTCRPPYELCDSCGSHACCIEDTLWVCGECRAAFVGWKSNYSGSCLDWLRATRRKRIGAAIRRRLPSLRSKPAITPRGWFA